MKGVLLMYEKEAEIIYRDLKETDIHIYGDDFSFEYYIWVRLNDLGVCLVTPFDIVAYEYSQNKEKYKKEVCCEVIRIYWCYLYGDGTKAVFPNKYGRITSGFYALPINRYKW